MAATRIRKQVLGANVFSASTPLIESGAGAVGTSTDLAHGDHVHPAVSLAGLMTNPMTTPADIIVGGTAGAPARLAKGADGTVLTVDPTTHLLVWAAPTGGGGGGGGPLDIEAPTGTPNGTLAAFTLVQGAPSADTALMLFKNGILQKPGSGNDFTLSGAVVTFEAGNIPQTGDILMATLTDSSAVTIGSATPLIESGSGSAGASGNASDEAHVHPAYGGGGGGATMADEFGTTISAPSAITFKKPLFLFDHGSGVFDIYIARPITLIATDPTYGDDCTANPVDARWTLAGPTPMSIVADGIKYALTITTARDRMSQPFTDTGQDFEIIAHYKALSNGNQMVGITCTDSSGTGAAYSPYNDGNAYLWAVSGWGYAGTEPSTVAPAFTDFWLSLRRIGTNWYGRWTIDNGVTWHTTLAYSNGATITEIGVGSIFGGGGTTAQLCGFNYATPDFGF